jgi:hypothetical protein
MFVAEACTMYNDYVSYRYTHITHEPEAFIHAREKCGIFFKIPRKESQFHEW